MIRDHSRTGPIPPRASLDALHARPRLREALDVLLDEEIAAVRAEDDAARERAEIDMILAECKIRPILASRGGRAA